jgi:hypothetical protein
VEFDTVHARIVHVTAPPREDGWFTVKLDEITNARKQRRRRSAHNAQGDEGGTLVSGVPVQLLKPAAQSSGRGAGARAPIATPRSCRGCGAPPLVLLVDTREARIRSGKRQAMLKAAE